MDKTFPYRTLLSVALGLAVLPLQAAAQVPAAPAVSVDESDNAAASLGPSRTDAENAWGRAAASMQHGPTTITLVEQASLELPQGFAFIPAAQGKALMEAMGNQIGDSFLGLVVPVSASDEDEWIATLDYEPAGYIKDDDARNWNAAELLSNLKEGTEAGNERRLRMGFSALEVTHWIEPPNYDDATQRLVWSVELREKSAAANDDHTVNYNTYVLGREGYISLDFITSQSRVEAEKPTAKALLSAISFDEGKRYADFNASTDRVAEYGLAALIGGIAAKKLGLLATLGVLFAKFFKLIAVGVVAIGAVLRKVFFGNKSSS